MELTTSSPEFVTWLAGCQNITNGYYSKNFPTLTVPVLTAEEGKTMIKIVATDTQRRVHSFVAKVDNTTKSLGSVKCGDVLKAATWKQPARHARGNLFDTHGGLSKMGQNGPAYL